MPSCSKLDGKSIQTNLFMIFFTGLHVGDRKLSFALFLELSLDAGTCLLAYHVLIYECVMQLGSTESVLGVWINS